METNTVLIQQITDILGAASGEVIVEYTKLTIVESIVWLGISVSALVYLFRWKIEEDTGNWDLMPAPAVRVFIMFICVIIIGSNLPDLFEPRAAAIHSLLQDIK